MFMNNEGGHRSGLPVRELCAAAILAALSVILARFLIPMPAPDMRLSLEQIPICLSGLLFGPLTGALTGFVSDAVGTIFSGYGFNPIFCIPPILYGLIPGLLRRCYAKYENPGFIRLLVMFLIPALIGSWLWQSFALSFTYGRKTFGYYLISRGIQFTITVPLDALITWLLFKNRLFESLHFWPPKPRKLDGKEYNSEDINMDLNEALEYIHAVSWLGSKPGLSREQELLRRLGNPEKTLKFVHIAGTNGKGSTAAMLASTLTKAGYNTGLYTSPYIYRFNERIQVCGEQIPDADVVRLVEKIKPLADSMEDHPTEFEVVTAVGFEYFAERNCDIVVCEVGLGGEFDATNVIDVPEAAVIVNIGLDHTQVLGDTVEEIAMAKAGILKPGGDCVLYAQQAGVEHVIARVCRERGLSLTIADTAPLTPVSHSIEGQVFDYRAYKALEIPLLGEHQLHNAATVLTTAALLRKRGWRISDEAIRAGLREVSWPGRFEVVGHEPLFIIDGGHNPQCLEALENALKDYLPEGARIIFLTGCMADKDFGEMYRSLIPYAAAFVTVTPRNPRALSAEALRDQLLPYGKDVTACSSVEDGVREALSQAGRDGIVVACGSLYMIGDIYDALKAL